MRARVPISLSFALALLACTGGATERPPDAHDAPPPASTPSRAPDQPEPEREPEPESPQPEPAMTNLKLELRVDGKRVSARLLNEGSAPTPVLHDPLLQPSRPTLSSSSGERLEPFDERSRAKFDNTVYRSQFVELGPGEAIDLGRASFEHGKAGWSLRWGEFTFSDIPAGEYELALSWSSTIERALDDGDDSVVTVEGVWLGELQAEPQAVTLR